MPSGSFVPTANSLQQYCKNCPNNVKNCFKDYLQKESDSFLLESKMPSDVYKKRICA